MQTRARANKNSLQCDHMGTFCKHDVNGSSGYLQKTSDEKQTPHDTLVLDHGAGGYHGMPYLAPKTSSSVFDGLASITSLFEEKELNFLADLEIVIELSPLGECEFPFHTKKTRRVCYK